MKKCEQNQARQKRAHDERKKKLFSLDDDTREFLTGKKDFTAGQPPSNVENLLIDAISRIAMHGSAAHEKRKSEVIRHAFFLYYENADLVYDVIRMRQLSKQTLHELSPNDNS